MLIQRALLAFSFLSSAALLRADFSGDFSVGTPGSYELRDADPAPTFDNWTASLNYSGASGGTGIIDTTGAPGAVTFSATGYPGGGTGSVTFSYTFTTGGMLSFNLTGSASVSLDGNPLTPVGTSYSFAVTPGQLLSFGASATGADSIIIPNPSGPPTIIDPHPVTNSGTISDFNLSAIPEPSTYAFAAGVCALGLTGYRRRRRA